MIDFNKCRERVFELMKDLGLEVTEATDDELRQLHDQVLPIVKSGEDLGELDYSDLHAAQILEPMVRWELYRRGRGEELPGMPYDPTQTAAEMREAQTAKRVRGTASPN